MNLNIHDLSFTENSLISFLISARSYLSETMILVLRFLAMKSSSIKQLAQFGGDISRMVPEIVAKALVEKYSDNE